MMSASCETIRQLIDRTFVEGRGDRQRLRGHLERCDACREYHDRLFAAPPPAGEQVLTTLERELLGQAVLAAGPAPVTARRPWWRAVAVGTAVAATAALALVLLLPSRHAPPAEDRELAARGGAGSGGAHDAELRLLCLCQPAGGSAPEVRSLPDRPLPGEQPVCRPGDRLGFTYRHGRAGTQHLTLFFFDAAGRSRGAAAPPLHERVSPSRDDAPLEAALALGPIGPGRLQVVAVFSDGALASGQLAAAGLAELERNLASTGALVLHRALEVGR